MIRAPFLRQAYRRYRGPAAWTARGHVGYPLCRKDRCDCVGNRSGVYDGLRWYGESLRRRRELETHRGDAIVDRRSGSAGQEALSHPCRWFLMTARVLVIAEAGVNHNGSLDLALGLVESAAASGADVVKFQTFRADKLVSTRARKATYQAVNTGGDDDQLGMLRGLELSEAAHEAIVARCRDLGIAFMSTAFDSESLNLLTRFDVPAIKLASGDVTAAPLVLQAARLRRKILLSTGMCTLSDIEEALGVIAFGLLGEQGPSKAAFAAAYASDAGQEALRADITLLHCSSEYPAAFADVNLCAMDPLR